MCTLFEVPTALMNCSTSYSICLTQVFSGGPSGVSMLERTAGWPLQFLSYYSFK